MAEQGIETIIEAIVSRIEAKNAAREKALTESRQIIRLAANSIRAIHRKESEKAAGMLEEGTRRVAGLKAELQNHPDIYWAGYVQDSQKEFIEARLLYAMVRSEPLPDPGELGVSDAPYLNGLGEAASELRRYILDIVRHGSGEMDRCEELLGKMEEVYSLLVTIDYPDVLTGGLRRTTDLVRGVLERTRGDLTVTVRQYKLEEALQKSGR